MRFSIWPTQAQPWDDIYEITAHCEQTGWDGVYFADHFMPNGPGAAPLDGDTLECWSIIAALAAVIPRLRIAPLVTQVCGGRLTLGVGAGWQVNEHAAYGIPLGTVRERLDRFEEAVQILRSLLNQPRTTFSGTYFQVQDAPAQPAPRQAPMPLLIGGSGERRMMRVAARHADQWNAWTTPELLAHKVSVLREHCEQAGRDPSEIHVSTQALLYLSTDERWLKEKREAAPRAAVIAGTPGEVADILGRYQEAGADELIIPDSTLGSPSQKKDTCDLFLNEVAAPFR
jgi:alkanesulfonate monooxygenase SsuD/methylene tetrahydromethanopterin reductase-like flavin-dependent oxidoreductase (luciferase family)